MTTAKMRINAHKVGFLVQQYPQHKIKDIIALLEMPAIDINTAVWVAQDLGFISEPDKEGNLKLLRPPARWDLGETVADLEHAIMYAFDHLSETKTDLEEHYLSQWTNGYSATDTLIVLNRLLTSEQLAEYVIEDGENTYKFFTLYENRDKRYGLKQFKKPPIGGEGSVK